MLTQSDHGVRFIGRIHKQICDFKWILNYQTTEGRKKDLLAWKSHVVALLVINKKWTKQQQADSRGEEKKEKATFLEN